MWPPTKCDDCKAGYGLRPSSLRVGVSTPCMTASTGVTSCGRRGSGSEQIVALPGSIELTLAAVEDYGVERMLDELAVDLRAGAYRPAPVRRVEIPKPDGPKRPLGIPTVVTGCASRRRRSSSNRSSRPTSCRAASASARGGRPPMPWRRSGSAFLEGSQFVFEADIARLLRADRPRAACCRWSRFACRTGGCSSCCASGCGQGCWRTGWCPRRSRARRRAGSSPRCWPTSTCTPSTGPGPSAAPGRSSATRTTSWCCAPLGSRPSKPRSAAIVILGELGLRLHPDKTRVVDLREGREGFDFLGCHLRARMSGRLWEQRRIIRYYLHRWPSQRSMKRARARVKALTGRSQVGDGVAGRHRAAEPVPSGMGQLLPHRERRRQVQPTRPTRSVATAPLAREEAGPQPARRPGEPLDATWFHDQGLHKLMGTIRYPKAA